MGVAARDDLIPKTIATAKKRASVHDAPMGPKSPHATRLTQAEEARIVTLRRHVWVPLDDGLYALPSTMPHLTRSAHDRWWQRHTTSCLPDTKGDAAARRRSPLLRSPRRPFRQWRPNTTQPWTNGQVERLHRTRQEAMVNQYDDQPPQHLPEPLHTFPDGGHLRQATQKPLRASPYDDIGQCWPTTPQRVTSRPYHHTRGLNTAIFPAVPGAANERGCGRANSSRKRIKTSTAPGGLLYLEVESNLHRIRILDGVMRRDSLSPRPI
jgi:hypothetical protein